MRRTINLIVALCLTVGGATAMAYLLLFAAGWRGWMVMAAGLLFTVGILWLYEDYIDATPTRENRNAPRPQRSDPPM